jgi:hypothetical protein
MILHAIEVEGNHGVCRRSRDKGGAALTARDPLHCTVAKLGDLQHRRELRDGISAGRALGRNTLALDSENEFQAQNDVTDYAVELLWSQWVVR